MPTTRPFIRIEFAEKEVVRFKKDLEDWQRLHEELAADCWFRRTWPTKLTACFSKSEGRSRPSAGWPSNTMEIFYTNST